MDAPKCRLCQEKHWGSCRDALTTTEKARRDAEDAKKPAARKKKSTKKIRGVISGEGGGPTHPDVIGELLARVESLEARVLELESRKTYMKNYMREKRAEGKA